MLLIYKSPGFVLSLPFFMGSARDTILGDPCVTKSITAAAYMHGVVKVTRGSTDHLYKVAGWQKDHRDLWESPCLKSWNEY